MIPALKSYPTYKPSGVEWLGDVPEHWMVKRGKALFHCVDVRSSTGEEELLTVSSERGVVPRSSATVTMFKAESYAGYKLCWPNDLVINSLWAWARGLGVARHHGIISSSYGVYRLRPSYTEYSAYVHDLVRSTPFNWELLVRSKGIWISRLQLTDEAFLGAPFPLPPSQEQSAIVRYLDHVDRRIRRYIRAKQKLIKLLEEQKQALIHQAVTGQIDVRTGRPYPAYRPSGVEWLGDVPEHWEKRRLKSISRIRYGLGQPPRELSDGLPLIRATNVDHGRIVEKDLVYVDALDVPKSRDAFLSKKEIIVVRSGAYTADSAIIPEAYEGAVAGYDMIVTVSGAQPEFIAIALLSNYVRDDQLIISSTRSAQPHINAEELGTAVLLFPPLDEQAAIVRYLDKATADIDIATDRARRQIDLLKEYRTRLIADVVTGKLDVREAVTGLPEVDLLADEFDVLTEAPETGMMELEDANETPEELAMENEATV